MTDKRISPLALAGLVLVLSTPALDGQDRPHYREFVLGSTLSSVSGQVHAAASDATVVHARPVLMQDLNWRQPYFVAGSSQPQTDAVERIVFSFYNDQLFRLAIDYDRQRTEGMTDADMIGALSETYGQALKSKPRALPASASRVGAEPEVPISRWTTDEYSVALLRSTFGDGFRVVVTSTTLDALARTADAQTARASQEKARAANKAAFRP